ncbi:O-antigen ligase family protein [Almyronema epifaneia]|uniref:O-antigen ligase family protein n=1 Tax=Almyronema epifaneia S1 TaxID=2991925 RepID=A0ABW6IAQ1_9CYAN
MGPTNLVKPSVRPTLAYLATVSLILLPFVNWVGLIGFVLLMGLCLYASGREIWAWLWQRGWVALAVALVIGTLFASDRPEALLQLSNFLPYFLLLGVLVNGLPTLPQPLAQLEEWASWLTITTMPINLLAIAEYSLMSPSAIAQSPQSPVLAWLYRLSLDENFGHRANVIFDHPNTLACYLTLVLGLNLGLLLSQSPRSERVGAWPFLGQRLRQQPLWLYLSVALILAGIFCAGSRNGLLVAIAEVVIVTICGQRHGYVKLAGLGGIVAIAASALWGGVGGRQLSVSLFSDDPRLAVWRIALEHIQAHPIWGIGLGNYKLLYVPNSIPGYERIYHAHNFWLHLAAEAGLPIAIAFTFLVGWGCYRGTRALLQTKIPPAQRWLLGGYGLAFLSCGLFSLFDVTLYEARVNLLGWLSLAVIYSAPDLLDQLSGPQAKE